MTRANRPGPPATRGAPAARATFHTAAIAIDGTGGLSE